MRKIVMFNWMTADGYFAAPDGNLNWIIPDPAQVKAAVGAIPRFDTIVFGRKTYQLFEGFWKGAVDDSGAAPDPHQPGQRSPDHGAIRIWMNDATKLVFSKTLKEASWKHSR